VEYRTPGGFYLRHPDYAAGILGLSLCLSEEMLNQAADESVVWKRMHRLGVAENFRRKYNLPKRENIRGVLASTYKRDSLKELPNIFKTLKSLESFDAHSKSIAKFFELTLNNKQYSPCLFDNW
jgi:hypothetical protein